jgi:hypothetical protein
MHEMSMHNTHNRGNPIYIPWSDTLSAISDRAKNLRHAAKMDDISRRYRQKVPFGLFFAAK